MRNPGKKWHSKRVDWLKKESKDAPGSDYWGGRLKEAEVALAAAKYPALFRENPIGDWGWCPNCGDRLSLPVIKRPAVVCRTCGHDLKVVRAKRRRSNPGLSTHQKILDGLLKDRDVSLSRRGDAYYHERDGKIKQEIQHLQAMGMTRDEITKMFPLVRRANPGYRWHTEQSKDELHIAGSKPPGTSKSYYEGRADAHTYSAYIANRKSKRRKS